MTELQKQVQRAQRRITLQRFLSACVWSLAGCLGVAAIALAVTKIWHIDVDPRQWQIGWLAGSVIAGLGIAGVWAWFHQFSMVEAAIEIDRRFGLKERVSSSLALSPEEAESEVGRALVSAEVGGNEALDLVASRFKSIVAEDGPDSTVFWASARVVSEANYLLQKFARTAIGTNNIDNCSRT